MRCLADLVDEKSVLILAPNPGVSVLALEFCRGHRESVALLRSGFAPASIACFSFEGPWSMLSSTSIRLTRFKTGRESQHARTRDFVRMNDGRVWGRAKSIAIEVCP